MTDETPKPNPPANVPPAGTPAPSVPPSVPPAAAVPAAPKPVVPAAAPAAAPLKPAVPLAVKPAGPASVERRHFIFTWLGFAWTAFAIATGSALATVLRFLFPNVLFEPNPTFKAGFPDTYEVGKVDERWKAKYGVWIVRTLEGFYALSTTCTHLGCTPSWLDGEQKFKCPCHGSGFYKTGINFEGPAPRPLERYRISLADDGQLFIDKSKKFQQEKGEWNDPECFLNFS